ncbi:MAG: YkgJ family cysteine cluster protein [Desulfobacteraceae bacterium]|nr:YkgJ family cysteine cluster protein [Desulfobacteraceae bacterium]
MTKADYAFQRMAGEFSESIKCDIHCSDCCQAVFGLFLIEAMFLKRDFDQLDEKEREAALKRGYEADKSIEELEMTLKKFENDPQMSAYSMARAKIRCPLLNDDNECILYPYRPITCRVYGIPTMIQGVPRVCGKTGFKKEESYPTFNLGGVHKELYQLSLQLLENAGGKDPEKASLLVSVSKVIKTPTEELIG